MSKQIVRIVQKKTNWQKEQKNLGKKFFPHNEEENCQILNGK